MSTAFSQSLAKLRQTKGVSQRKAAADLGVSQALLSHYENGIREPGLDFLGRACDYYEVSSDFLLGRTETKTEPAGVPLRTEANSTEFEVETLTEIDRKLLSDSINVIGGILENTGNRKLINDVFAYFALAVYKMMRRITNGDADRIADLNLRVPDLSADAAMKQAELNVALELEKTNCYETGKLDEAYPETYSSLMQVVYNAGVRVKRL